MKNLKTKLTIPGTCILAITVSLCFLKLTGWEVKSESADDSIEIKREYIPPIKPDIVPGESFSIKEDSFKSGDTLATLLQRHGLTPGEIHYLAEAMSSEFSPKKIRRGTPVIVFSHRDTGKVQKLFLDVQKMERLVVTRSDSEEWLVEKVDRVLFTRTNQVSGVIENSLWNSARESQMPAETILDMADMFGWQVDFTSGLRKGDSFNVIYKSKVIQDGGLVPGEIMAARFVNEGVSHTGFRFEFEEDQFDYFDSDGNSLRREFLKTPLRYRYISSGYSRKRFHPILKIYRPHLGIDYAAPTGTPVSALGDGIVVFCGRKGGYGKFIQVKHGDAYETCYGHLSGYAKGLKKGSRVKQGQVIGYVGSTGLSTGPHLDFRVKYRGNFINPGNIKSEPAKPIPDELKEKFQAHCSAWLERLI